MENVGNFVADVDTDLVEEDKCAHGHTEVEEGFVDVADAVACYI